MLRVAGPVLSALVCAGLAPGCDGVEPAPAFPRAPAAPAPADDDDERPPLPLGFRDLHITPVSAPALTSLGYALDHAGGVCAMTVREGEMVLATALGGQQGRLSLAVAPGPAARTITFSLLCVAGDARVEHESAVTYPAVPALDLDPVVAPPGTPRTLCWSTTGAATCSAGLLDDDGQVVAGIASDVPGGNACRTFVPAVSGQVGVACRQGTFDLVAQRPLVSGTGALRLEVVPAALDRPGRVHVAYEGAGASTCDLRAGEAVVATGLSGAADVELAASTPVDLVCDGATVASRWVAVGPEILHLSAYVDRALDEVMVTWQAPGATQCSLHADDGTAARVLSTLGPAGSRTITWPLGGVPALDLALACFAPGQSDVTEHAAPVPHLVEVATTPRPWGVDVCYQATGLVDGGCALHEPGVVYLYPLPVQGCAEVELSASSGALLYCSGTNGYVAQEVFLDVDAPGT